LKPNDDVQSIAPAVSVFWAGLEIIIVNVANGTTQVLDERVENRQSVQFLRSAKTAYVFRCGESGLYAFTLDPNGHALPSRIYPAIRWQFDRTVTLRPDRISPQGHIAGAVLAAIAKHGFHLTHVAVTAELQTVSGQRQQA
jgi:hypothetical protein